METRIVFHEEDVRAAARCLAALETRHRPASLETLARFLRQKCGRVRADEPLSRDELVPAMLPFLVDMPALYAALELLAPQHSAGVVSAERERLIERTGQYAAQKLRKLQGEFESMSLRARMKWLYSQANPRLQSMPMDLIAKLRSHGYISVGDASRLVYDDALLRSSALRLTGIVRAFRHGFGFIRESSGNNSLFVHKNDLQGQDLLNDCDIVEYERILDERSGKPKAANVRVIGRDSKPDWEVTSISVWLSLGRRAFASKRISQLELHKSGHLKAAINHWRSNAFEILKSSNVNGVFASCSGQLRQQGCRGEQGVAVTIQTTSVQHFTTAFTRAARKELDGHIYGFRTALGLPIQACETLERSLCCNLERSRGTKVVTLDESLHEQFDGIINILTRSEPAFKCIIPPCSKQLLADVRRELRGTRRMHHLDVKIRDGGRAALGWPSAWTVAHVVGKRSTFPTGICEMVANHMKRAEYSVKSAVVRACKTQKLHQDFKKYEECADLTDDYVQWECVLQRVASCQHFPIKAVEATLKHLASCTNIQASHAKKQMYCEKIAETRIDGNTKNKRKRSRERIVRLVQMARSHARKFKYEGSALHF